MVMVGVHFLPAAPWIRKSVLNIGKYAPSIPCAQDGAEGARQEYLWLQRGTLFMHLISLPMPFFSGGDSAQKQFLALCYRISG